MSKLLTVFVIFIVVLNVVKNSENSISVRIKNGLINGKLESFEDKNVNTFLGIPYAEPPVGRLRFRKPVPVKEWSQPVKAIEWMPSCIQKPISDNNMIPNTSEDCLYLNVWSPVDDIQPADQLKPVMFWIHGGGLRFGSGSQLSGHVLAIKGDVVVVTINYRLNIFGFLYTETDDSPGNMGLWDQALALEWVNDYIKYFGGDPNRVTIFGNSAGSWSTSLHILSPVSRHLFQNAIMMSGAAINRIAGDTPENVLSYWLRGAEALGCFDDENSEQNTKFTQKMIECLHKIPAQELVHYLSIPNVEQGLSGMLSQVVIDNQFLLNKPYEMLKNGDYKQGINLLIGTVEDEGSFLLPSFVDPIKYYYNSPLNMTYNESYSELSRISSTMVSKEPINGEEVAKLYFNGLSDNNSADLLRRTVGIAIGDFLLGCPTIAFAKSLAETDKKCAVYQYYYNSKIGKGRYSWSYWMGCSHSDDTYPVFGVPFYKAHDFVDREREISQQMINIFTQFARTGKPPAQGGAQWYPYHLLNDHIIAPYYEITSEPKLNTNYGIGLKVNECEYLWNRYIEKQ